MDWGNMESRCRLLARIAGLHKLLRDENGEQDMTTLKYAICAFAFVLIALAMAGMNGGVV
jgi:hypothetical protein